MTPSAMSQQDVTLRQRWTNHASRPACSKVSWLTFEQKPSNSLYIGTVDHLGLIISLNSLCHIVLDLRLR